MVPCATQKNSLESDAKAEIERESKEAKINNIYLKDHLSKQSKVIYKQCAHYNSSNEKLVNLKIRTDLSESRNGMQSQKILQLEETNSKYKRQIRSFQEGLRSKQEQERNLLQKLDEIKAENTRIQNENFAADAVIEKLLDQVAELSSKTRSPKLHKKYKAANAKGTHSLRNTAPEDSPSTKQTTAKAPSETTAEALLETSLKKPLEIPLVDYAKMWNSAARGQENAMIF